VNSMRERATCSFQEKTDYPGAEKEKTGVAEGSRKGPPAEGTSVKKKGGTVHSKKAVL